MRFALHQPSFIPWPGFFYKASKVDALVLLDQTQYPRGFTWINRNRIKGQNKELWLTIPVVKKGLGLQKIDQVLTLQDRRWHKKHLLSIRHNYRQALFFDEHYPFFENLYNNPPERLVDWNISTTKYLYSALGLKENILLQSELGVVEKSTRLIALIAERLGAKVFVAPAPAKGHIDTELLNEHGVQVEWLRFFPPYYPQFWGDFVKNLSVIDLIFLYGPYAWKIISDAQHS